MAARLLISMLIFFEDTYTLKQWVKSPTRLLVNISKARSSNKQHKLSSELEGLMVTTLLFSSINKALEMNRLTRVAPSLAYDRI